MTELLIIGSWLFWVIISILSIAVIASVEYENSIAGSIAIVAGLALFHKAILASVNWQTLLIVAIIYFFLGGVWSIIKWLRFTNKQVDEYKQMENPTAQCYNKLQYNLKASSNKQAIYTWIAFWPWSVLWAMTHDLIKHIYELLSGVYNRISSRALGRVKPQY
jgi:hypothetical protein